jgi:hypothetical protein
MDAADRSTHADDMLDLNEAAEELGVDAAQASAMVEQGLLVSSGGPDDDRRFSRAAVEAVRLAGG